MKIAVCMKQVPNIGTDGMDKKTGLMIRNKDNVIENPYDLAALEAALQLKDAYGATVNVFTMGPLSAADLLMKAYSMGIDKGYLISDKCFSGADVLATSYTLYQSITSRDKYDLIICGERTIDGDTAQVGAEIAAWYNYSFYSKVIEIVKIDKESINIRYQLNNYAVLSKTNIPCVIAVKKPRVPTLKLKIKSRQKNICTLGINDLNDKNCEHYGIKASPTKVKKIYPVKRTKKNDIMYFDRDINVQGIISIFEKCSKQY